MFDGGYNILDYTEFGNMMTRQLKHLGCDYHQRTDCMIRTVDFNNIRGTTLLLGFHYGIYSTKQMHPDSPSLDKKDAFIRITPEFAIPASQSSLDMEAPCHLTTSWLGLHFGEGLRYVCDGNLSEITSWLESIIGGIRKVGELSDLDILTDIIATRIDELNKTCIIDVSLDKIQSDPFSYIEYDVAYPFDDAVTVGEFQKLSALSVYIRQYARRLIK